MVLILTLWISWCSVSVIAWCSLMTVLFWCVTENRFVKYCRMYSQSWPGRHRLHHQAAVYEWYQTFLIFGRPVNLVSSCHVALRGVLNLCCSWMFLCVCVVCCVLCVVCVVCVCVCVCNRYAHVARTTHLLFYFSQLELATIADRPDADVDRRW